MALAGLEGAWAQGSTPAAGLTSSPSVSVGVVDTSLHRQSGWGYLKVARSIAAAGVGRVSAGVGRRTTHLAAGTSYTTHGARSVANDVYDIQQTMHC
jgi:hypothetical protein